MRFWMSWVRASVWLLMSVMVLVMVRRTAWFICSEWLVTKLFQISMRRAELRARAEVNMTSN